MYNLWNAALGGRLPLHTTLKCQNVEQAVKWWQSTHVIWKYMVQISPELKATILRNAGIT